jgi:hypothetical protein
MSDEQRYGPTKEQIANNPLARQCQAPSELSPAQCSAMEENMAMLIRRLCRVIAKHDPNNTVRERALNFLYLNGLGGSPLRGQSLNTKLTDSSGRKP